MKRQTNRWSYNIHCLFLTLRGTENLYCQACMTLVIYQANSEMLKVLLRNVYTVVLWEGTVA